MNDLIKESSDKLKEKILSRPIILIPNEVLTKEMLSMSMKYKSLTDENLNIWQMNIETQLRQTIKKNVR